MQFPHRVDKIKSRVGNATLQLQLNSWLETPTGLCLAPLTATAGRGCSQIPRQDVAEPLEPALRSSVR
jgi:hypothetical protein